jgi:hypothetical protein
MLFGSPLETRCPLLLGFCKKHTMRCMRGFTMRTMRMALVIGVLLAGTSEARAQISWVTPPKTGSTAGGTIFFKGNIGKVNCTQVQVKFYLQGGILAKKPDFVLDVDKNGNFGNNDYQALKADTTYEVQVLALDTKTNEIYALSGEAKSSK